jgi:hypothetical protein
VTLVLLLKDDSEIMKDNNVQVGFVQNKLRELQGISLEMIRLGFILLASSVDIGGIRSLIVGPMRWQCGGS